MKKYLPLLVKVFKPHTIILIFLVVLSAVAVPLSFTKMFKETAFAYGAYLISAYALTAVCFRIPDIYKAIHHLIFKNKFIYRYFNDVRFKVFVGLIGSFSINFLYAVFKLVYSSVTGAFWFGAVSVYYVLLCVVRFYLIYKLPLKRTTKSYYTEMKIYRITGVFMLCLNLALSIMIFEVIRDKDWTHYRGIVIYAVAAYTFYCLIMAIVNLVRYRKLKSPVLSAAKCINLTTALVSLFSLQTAMFNQFGTGTSFEYLLNSITGVIVCTFAMAIAIYMCVRSTRILRHHKNNNTDLINA